MASYDSSVVKLDMDGLCRSFENHEQLYHSSILVTGATGMMATYCIYFLLSLNDKFNAGITITGLIRNLQKAEVRFADILHRSDFILLEQDITTPFQDNLAYDYIIHLAGSASAYAIVHDPISIISANVTGTINVMELAKKRKGCRVLFASTREVYGKLPDDVTLIDEDMLGVVNSLDTRSCYPESKRMAENIVVTYGKKYDMIATIARIAHSYGPGMSLHDDGRIMADLIGNAVDGTDIKLKSDGSAKRSFCYLTDAIDAVMRILLAGENCAVYNVANETEEISILELARLIRRCVPEKNISVVLMESTQAEKKGYLNIPRIKLSTSKIEKLGWYPHILLEDGIKKTVSLAVENISCY